MTRKEFENLKVGDYFHDTVLGNEWQIKEILPLELFASLCTKGGKIWSEGEINQWHISVSPSFTIGRHPDNISQAEAQQITCTVAEALEKGLKVRDKLIIELEFEVTDVETGDLPVFVKNKLLGFEGYLAVDDVIPFTPQPYQPAHDEICTVLTTEGLATKCKAYHHNGVIYAIALKNDKPDGTFAPEQIAKFLKL